MKILNFGSLNIDNVYRVANIVRPGETISSISMEIHCGGKGLNQSLALAKAGMEVFHAGMVGREDGSLLLNALSRGGVRTELIGTCEGKSGHCVIQVDDRGQNSIVLCGGANHAITKAYVQEVMDHMEPGGLLLLQNEINHMELILKEAKKRGLFVILNPSPMDETLINMDLSGVGMFLLNEVEGADIAGVSETEEIIEAIQRKYPGVELVLTLGSQGSVYAGKYGVIRQAACRVNAVDTTAAGDTFTGYFISEYFAHGDVKKALELASRASAIAVTRPGAAESIPVRSEVEAYKKQKIEKFEKNRKN